MGASSLWGPTPKRGEKGVVVTQVTVLRQIAGARGPRAGRRALRETGCAKAGGSRAERDRMRTPPPRPQFLFGPRGPTSCGLWPCAHQAADARMIECLTCRVAMDADVLPPFGSRYPPT